MDGRGSRNMYGALSEQLRPLTNYRKESIPEQSQIGIASNKTYQGTYNENDKNKALIFNRT